MLCYQATQPVKCYCATVTAQYITVQLRVVYCSSATCRYTIPFLKRYRVSHSVSVPASLSGLRAGRCCCSSGGSSAGRKKVAFVEQESDLLVSFSF